MIQKKICMVGVYGTGKTCLVQQYVHSIFTQKYLSTVGVKIDRKDIKAGGQDVRLMLWDLEGREGDRDVNGSYVRGAHGIIYVADGTRPETAEQLFDIRKNVIEQVGEILFGWPPDPRDIPPHALPLLRRQPPMDLLDHRAPRPTHDHAATWRRAHDRPHRSRW